MFKKGSCEQYKGRNELWNLGIYVHQEAWKVLMNTNNKISVIPFPTVLKNNHTEVETKKKIANIKVITGQFIWKHTIT